MLPPQTRGALRQNIGTMPSRLRFLLILGALTSFGPLSVDMYLPAFPAIAADLQTDAASVQGTLSAYFLGLAVAHFFYGPLSDRYGRRGPLLVGFSIYVAATIACALAPAIESLWAARAVQALGGCAGMVVARAAVRDLYSGAEGARFLSRLWLVLGIAPIVGPYLGALLVEHFGWRAIFWLLVGLGLIALATILFALPETHPPAHRSRGGIRQALAAYGEVVADRRFLAPAVVAGFLHCGLFAYFAAGPFVFIELLGLSPAGFGIVFAVNAIGLVILSQVNARLVMWYGPVRMLLLALAVYAACAFVMLVLALAGAIGLLVLLPPLFGVIATLGAVYSNALALAVEPFPRAAGSATALFGAIQFTFGSIVGTLAGWLGDGTALPMIGLIAAGALGAAIASRWLRARPAARA